MQQPIGLDSLCVRDPQVPQYNPPHQVPIVAASSFVFDNIETGMRMFEGAEPGHIYSRFGNPTVDAAAAKIAAIESHGTGREATALLTSSGMGAISTVLLGLSRPGDAILTQADLYGGTASLINDVLQPLGIKSHVTNLRDLDGVERLLREKRDIRLLYCETPSNPTLRCVDLAALSELAHRYDARLVVDNTFATPILQQPLAHGADIVVHSTTKYLNGHGTGIAGVLVAADPELLKERFLPVLRLVGPSANAWDAWLVLNGLKTLALRMERHSANARRIAAWLRDHPRVTTVNHPSLPDHPEHELATRQMRDFGGMMSFEVEGGLEAGIRFMNRVRFCTLTPTLGDVDTLILHPASMSHRGIAREVRLEHGISDGLIRLSVGVENVEDILGDLEEALKE